jgi:hypothetical protein
MLCATTTTPRDVARDADSGRRFVTLQHQKPVCVLKLPLLGPVANSLSAYLNDERPRIATAMLGIFRMLMVNSFHRYKRGNAVNSARGSDKIFATEER